jgi:hypothetical protein
MAKVLLTWEGGAYLGHQMLVTSAAAVLHADGHQVVIVAPAGVPANEAARHLGLDWENISAAPAEPLSSPGVPWESRATTLWQFGMHSEDVIRDRFHAWDRMLQRQQPAVAFMQAAPFAQIAAHVLQVPSVEFGIGFDVPPRAMPFPPFRHPDTFEAHDAVRLEQHIVDTIARVVGRAARGRTLHEMVSAPVRLVTSIRELDHYDGSEDPTREFVGPLPVVQLGQARPAWQRRGPRVLAYVRANLLHMTAFLKALAALRGDAVVVCPDAAPEHVAQARALKLRLHSAPVSLGDLLPGADLVISHAGGLMAEALVRGRPCVALPSHYEQFMTALTLKRRGLGVVVNPAEPALYERALRHALADVDLRRNAAAVGMRYRDGLEAAGVALRRAARGPP